jgi:hypothetical protein
MKERKISMGEGGGGIKLLMFMYLFIYLYVYLYVYLRLISYLDYTIYHIDYVITVFSFTISFSCTEECHSKPSLPG